MKIIDCLLFLQSRFVQVER